LGVLYNYMRTGYISGGGGLGRVRRRGPTFGQPTVRKTFGRGSGFETLTPFSTLLPHSGKVETIIIDDTTYITIDIVRGRPDGCMVTRSTLTD